MKELCFQRGGKIMDIIKNTIICGNCIEEMKKIPNNSIDLIFADPPYWMRVEGILHRPTGKEYDGCDDLWDNQFNSLEHYEQFTEQWLSECKRILSPKGSFWVIGGMQCIYTIGAIMQKLGFWTINDVIWQKKNPTPNFKGTRLNNAHETLIWAVKDKKSSYTFNYKTAKELNLDTVMNIEYNKGIRKQLGSVWKISVCQGLERLKDENGNKLHNTQKPEELLYRIIAISSKKGDTVLDPFGGTMTTATVAKKMGRKSISIEREKKYCEFGQKRLDEAVEKIGEIENAIFDVKPPKVSMQEMIDKQLFFLGEKMYFKNTEKYVVLNSVNSVKQYGIIVDMHKAAAIASGGKAERLNGWEYWSVARENNLISINEIRQKYIREYMTYE